jgi:hypothetical protein
MKRFWLAFGLWVAACGADPVLSPTQPVAPTATLRQLPTATARPVFLTPLPTDTPLPTFTPLPTATPIAYIIKQGDTLLGIAIQHDVSIESLEAANPGINANALQIGQTVFIPSIGGEAAPNQSALPTPLPVSVAPFNCLPSPVSSLICLGEFINTTDQPIANLSVRVAILDADNNVSDSQIAYAPLDVIPPGAAIPLGAVFASGSAASALAVPVTADSGAALMTRYAMLTIGDLTGRATSAGFTLTLTLTNPAAAPVSAVRVVGTVYNASGVAGFRTVTLVDPLNSNDSVQVSISLPGVTQITRWAALAQGRLP